MLRESNGGAQLSGVRSVLFDVDGTLLDSMEFILQAFEHALRVHDRARQTREAMRVALGAALEECYVALDPQADAQALARSHREFQKENLHLIRPYASSEAVLIELKRRGMKLAAVTTRSAITSIRTLEDAGLTRYLDTIVSAEDVTRLKPDPEPVLLALERIGGLPEEAIMIGDTWADVQAGKNAGTYTAGVLYGFSGEDIRKEEPTLVLSDLVELLDHLR